MADTFREKLLAAWAKRERPLQLFFIEISGPAKRRSQSLLYAPDEGFALADEFHSLSEELYPNHTHPLQELLPKIEVLRLDHVPVPVDAHAIDLEELMDRLTKQ